MSFEKKINEILNFIKKSKKEKIKNELYNIIKFNEYCPIVIGEGYFGKVYIPEVNKTIPIKIKNTNIDIPIVIKETKKIDNPDAYAEIDIIDKKLYISGYDNITTEALILMYVRQLWNKTVNLPLILGYGTCSNTKMINRIITQKHGLDKNIEINLKGKIFDEFKMWFKPKKELGENFTSTIATLADLFTYIYYSKNKNGSVVLPNGIKCDNISKLFDYLCISYLATHQLLTENGIYPSDMHAKNIFIHWLNEKSFYGDKKIKNIKEIVYKIKDKYYKIKTFGFVLILGDIGSFMLKVKKDILIIGQIWDIKKNYKLIQQRLKPEHTNIDFIMNHNYLTRKEFHKTIAFNILNSEPYCSLPTKGPIAWDISYLNKLKSTTELLKFYDKKYSINKYIKNKNNILIDVKKYKL